ncbi:MAG: molybdenum cofactor guanylyltransferase [Solirubrobacteraceae bacterium]
MSDGAQTPAPRDERRAPGPERRPPGSAPDRERRSPGPAPGGGRAPSLPAPGGGRALSLPAPGGGRALLAVLAGGAGSRLGGDKPRAPLRGRPLISYALDAAAGARLQTVVVAKRGTRLPDVDALGGALVLVEPAELAHPLAGVIAALEHGAGRPVVAVGCDMPFLSPGLLAELGRRTRPTVARIAGRIEPLLARHEHGSLPCLEAALAERLSFSATLLRLRYESVEERELARFGDVRRLCFNVNDRADLAVAESWLAADGL